MIHHIILDGVIIEINNYPLLSLHLLRVPCIRWTYIKFFPRLASMFRFSRSVRILKDLDKKKGRREVTRITPDSPAIDLNS